MLLIIIVIQIYFEQWPHCQGCKNDNCGSTLTPCEHFDQDYMSRCGWGGVDKVCRCLQGEWSCNYQRGRVSREEERIKSCGCCVICKVFHLGVDGDHPKCDTTIRCVGVTSFVFHVLQLLLIRGTQQNSYCISKSLMRHSQKLNWKLNLSWFSYDYSKWKGLMKSSLYLTKNFATWSTTSCALALACRASVSTKTLKIKK